MNFLVCAAGLATSNTRGRRRFRLSTALCVDDFGQSYGDGTSVRARGVRCKTINAGPMPSSQHRGCSPFMQPTCRRVNPDEATTDWRAVCGRTACTVRRAGRARALSDPYATYRYYACPLVPSVDRCWYASFPYPARRTRKSKPAVQVKYRSPDGETWSGRGHAPLWLRQLELQGHSREEYAVTEG